MRLPVWRQLPYISPSTFLKWQSCQHRVYLSRLAGFKYKHEPQGLAAAYGSAFDSFIKGHIAKELNIKTKVLTTEHLLRQTVDKQHQDVAIPMGKYIAEEYLKLGIIDEFIKPEVKLDQELYGMHNAIPILGQLDMIPNDMPFDWKTGGFTSYKGRYPKKGWWKKWVLNVKTGDIKEYESHDEKPLDKIDTFWATQMCMYDWLLHNPERPYIIHEIVQHANKISFVIYRGNISQEFNDTLENQVAAMWSNITNDMYHAHILEPTPSRWVCHKFGVLCEVSEECIFYQRTLGDPSNIDAK